VIVREKYVAQVETALRRSPVVALLGPRQCGKTTLARHVCTSGVSEFFDLGSPRDQQRLQNPEMTLEACRGLVVLDEIQDKPELFSVLRSVVDQGTAKGPFLLLGSASPSLVKGASESLAGRIEFVDLTPFLLREVGYENQHKLWVRGGFPRSYLARSMKDSVAWREGFVRTFLQRDLPQLGITIPAPAMRRFWTMLAHYHGQTWNASDISRSLGVSDKTVRSYLDILTQTYMIRQLQPWYENLGKRQVKAPKIYFRDSGLMHSLLSLEDASALMGHPRVGASWEGFALEQVLGLVRPATAYYWATYSGGEIDLLFESGGKRYGVECKFAEAPSVTTTTRHLVEVLGLHHLWIVCPCKQAYPLDKRITVTSLEALAQHGATLAV